MQRLLGLFPVLLSLTVVWLAGCKEETTTQVVGSSMYVRIDPFYLSFDPYEDTASTFILIGLRDGRNEPMVGVPVSVVLSDTNHRWISPSQPDSDRVTNGLGELYLRYCSTTRGTQDTITFTAAGMSVTKVLSYVIIIDEGPGLAVWTETDTVYLIPNQLDSVRVNVQLTDNWQVVPHYQVYLNCSGGWLGWLPTTDSMGHATTWWHSDGTLGQFRIVGYGLEVTDAAWVTVLPPPIGQVRILAPDTLRIVHGDSAAVPVTIIVTSQSGYVLPHRVVSTSLANPMLGFLEYVNPQLSDTTDEIGQVRLLYHALDIGMQWILANCEGVSAADSIVTLWEP